MESIQVEIFHEGKIYIGELSAVSGGGTDVYHLMIDHYYWGRLRKARGQWVFDATPTTAFIETIATDLGNIVEGKSDNIPSSLWQFEYSTGIVEWPLI